MLFRSDNEYFPLIINSRAIKKETNVYKIVMTIVYRNNNVFYIVNLDIKEFYNTSVKHFIAKYDEFYIIDSKNELIMSEFGDTNNSNNLDDIGSITKNGAMLDQSRGYYIITVDGVKKDVIYETSSLFNWVFIRIISLERLNEALNSLLYNIMISCIFILAIIIILVFLDRKSVV